MAKDATFSNVGLLLHFDGADGSATFTDSSPRPKVVTAFGAQISTAQSKYGGASGLFAQGNYLTVPPSADLGFGTGDFTIEFWVRPALTGDSVHEILDFRSADIVEPLVLGFTTGGAVRYYDGAVVRVGTSGLIAANTWSHIAWCRQSNVNRIYVNGVMNSTYTASQNFGASRGLCIGANVIKNAERFVGNIDELRLKKGEAVYTSNFTPPPAPFPQAGDLSGLVEDASGAPAARLVCAMREDTRAFAGSTVSDATTGAYKISVNSEGAHTLNFYPADGEDLPALVLRGVVPV